MFLTPEQLPFYGGTYFPPEPRHGMPAWTQVLQAIAESWSERSEEIRAGGERLRGQLSGGAQLTPSAQPIGVQSLDAAVAALRDSFDRQEGGFGGAPKFPQASALEFLLLRGEREMTLQTLRAMAGGGIHDQVGGGFARYSVDRSWTVPHFEKMLYDNALLARAYLHGWQAFGERRLLDVCLDTLAWAMREMRGQEGGFYSALDADSEGVEGRYYVWTLGELRDVLGDDADAAIDWFDATEQGNFSDPHHPQPGWNVLTDREHTRVAAELHASTRERIRAGLLAARERRVRPGLDDKRLTSWNALMISALADTGAALRDEPVDGVGPALAQTLLDAAVGCAQFVLDELRDERGHLLRSYNDGRAKIDGFLEDHAFLLEAMLVLFETTCEERWFDHATTLADELIARFADAERGGFFSTADRPRGADRAAQGSRGLADPRRRVQRGERPAAPGPADRRRGLRAPRRVGARAAARDRAPSSGRVRPSAAGRALVPLPRAADRLRGAQRGEIKSAQLARRCTHARLEAAHTGRRDGRWPVRTGALRGSTGSDHAPTA